MAAEFLAALVAQRRTVVTILHANQYQGLASFSEVGAFVPLCRDRVGVVTREVASARFALPLPDHPGQSLPLAVALIRDLSSRVPVIHTSEDTEAPGWDADLTVERWHWCSQRWVATTTPRAPTRARGTRSRSKT